MKKIRTKMAYIVILLIVFYSTIPVFNMNLIKSSMEMKNKGKNPHPADITFTRQWLNNSKFKNTIIPWFPDYGGDVNDVNATYEQGLEFANLSVLGDSGKYSLVGIPNSTWTAFPNYDWGVFFNEGAGERGIDNDGIWVDYLWDEQTDQTGNTPSAHWKKNITLPFDMSDYKITSASLEVIFNATVQVSAVGDGGIDCPGDTSVLQVGDYAKFYVLISDIENVYQPFQVAYNKTRYLGKDTPPTPTIDDKPMTPIDQGLLIDYLELVLGVNHTTFTMTLGIDLYCEDNDPSYDEDSWDDLRIKYYNLTFTYEKVINQFTSMSWNQDGDKPSDISGNPIVVNEAILYFQYKINDIWPSSSPNSEIRILINDIPHSETVKLSDGITTFQDAKTGGFDVTSLISEDNDVNLSLQVFLADEFELNRTITISIDDVYLNITYTEIIGDILTTHAIILNGVNKTDDPVIALPLDENLNITVKYMNEQTGEHIPNATVRLEGKVTDPLIGNDTLEQYSATINTSALGVGVTILRVVAEKEYYETKKIDFFVEVTERETELKLFLNGNPKNESDIIKVEINETINVTVHFRDFQTKNHLPNATVNLLGIGRLNETDQQYNITINANALEQGITALTIFAQLVNYQPQVIHFFIEVIERSTKILLFLNDQNKTLDPAFNLTIGRMINITVKFMDNQTGNPIPNATIQLIGEGLSLELTENKTLGQYYKVLNTTDLKIGVNLFTIIAYATNYQIKTIYPRITVNRISTIINIPSQINAEQGDDVTLEVILNDIDFGGTIKNAIVTYVWAYGQGEFVERDNTGIYEVVLENVPAGVFPITISAFKSVDYAFESIEITLIVSAPVEGAGTDWSWLVYILIGAIVGLVTVFGLYQSHFKHPPMIRKIRKLRKRIRKGKKTKPIMISKRKDIIKSKIQSQINIIEFESQLANDKLKEFKK